jgi:serine/threonine protein kinase
VYSFGVVLFEVLCARPPIDNSLPAEEVNLADWAMKLHRKGQLEKIIDPVLVGKIKPSSLRKFSEIAEKCLKQNSIERPSMREVVYDLNMHSSFKKLQCTESNMKSAQQIFLHLGCSCLMFGIFLFRKMMKHPLEGMMILFTATEAGEV